MQRKTEQRIDVNLQHDLPPHSPSPPPPPTSPAVNSHIHGTGCGIWPSHGRIQRCRYYENPTLTGVTTRIQRCRYYEKSNVVVTMRNPTLTGVTTRNPTLPGVTTRNPTLTGVTTRNPTLSLPRKVHRCR